MLRGPPYPLEKNSQRFKLMGSTGPAAEMFSAVEMEPPEDSEWVHELENETVSHFLLRFSTPLDSITIVSSSFTSTVI